MNYREFMQALRNCRAVYGYVRFNDDTGRYMQLQKREVKQWAIAYFNQWPESDFDADLCTDGGLYIN